MDERRARSLTRGGSGGIRCTCGAEMPAEDFLEHVLGSRRAVDFLEHVRGYRRHSHALGADGEVTGVASSA